MRASAILLFGPPAAGKSQLAQALLETYKARDAGLPLLYLSTDQLRATISGREYLPSARSVVYDGMESLLRSALKRRHHVLIDGNYLDPDRRLGLTQVALEDKARFLKVLVDCTVEVGLARNAARPPESRVPEDYIREVYGRLEQAEHEADFHLDSRHDLTEHAAPLLDWLLAEPS